MMGFSIAKVLGVLFILGGGSAVPARNTYNNYNANTNYNSDANSFATPNSFNDINQIQQTQQPQQWNGGYNNGGYVTPNYYRNNQQYNRQPQYAPEDDQYRYQYQNPPYIGGNAGNYPYSDEESSQFSMPMMEPIRRMYHVYEDNVRGFAKRFRNMVYTPLRMMG